MSSILSQSANVIDVAVQTQSMIVRNSNTNGHNINLRIIKTLRMIKYYKTRKLNYKLIVFTV